VARVKITRIGDGTTVAGRPRAAGEVIVVDARVAAALVAGGVAVYLDEQAEC